MIPFPVTLHKENPNLLHKGKKKIKSHLLTVKTEGKRCFPARAGAEPLNPAAPRAEPSRDGDPLSRGHSGHPPAPREQQHLSNEIFLERFERTRAPSTGEGRPPPQPPGSVLGGRWDLGFSLCLVPSRGLGLKISFPYGKTCVCL